jgi:hypothetical protein
LTTQEEVEFPHEIPNIMKSCVHPLTTERAVNVSSIASNEDATNSQLRCMAVMNAEIAAPVQSVRLDSLGGPVREYSLHEFE